MKILLVYNMANNSISVFDHINIDVYMMSSLDGKHTNRMKALLGDKEQPRHTLGFAYQNIAHQDRG